MTVGDLAAEAGNESGYKTAGGKPIAFTEDVTLLLEIPKESFVVAESVRPRPGNGVVGLVYQSGEERFKACLNNVCGPYVQRVARQMPVISPNGMHWAAIVRDRRRVHVLLNGQMSQGYDMVHHVIFSPDSMKIAYISRQDGDVKFLVHVNQDLYGPFDVVGSEGLKFSNDSRYLAFTAQRAKKAWTVMINGKAGAEFEEIKHVTFSPDSMRLAYAAKKGGQWHLVEENTAEERRAGKQTVIGPDAMDIFRVVFSPKSKQTAYVARFSDGIAVVRNGQQGKVYDFVASGPMFSPDGNRLAYVVQERGRRGKVHARMVVNEEPSSVYDEIGAYYFSADGDFVYMVQEGEKGRIVHNDEIHEAHVSVGGPIVAPKTGRLAYPFFEDGQWAVKIDGKKGPRFDWVESLAFCPNGERVVYLAGREGATVFERQYMIVEDETVLGTYSWAGLPVFSPDGKHLVYGAAEEGEAFLVVDGQKGKERFLSFIKGSQLGFTDDNIVQGLAIRDEIKEFYLIRAKILRD